MEQRKPNQKIGAFGTDNSNLQQSINAEKASAQMYDNMSNASMQFADKAFVYAINDEIKSASTEGAKKGTEGSAIDPKTLKTKGYTPEQEIFKWDEASNKAAKTSFEANVNSRASTAMKDLAKFANGDMNKYNTRSKELATQVSSGIQDDAQRDYVLNAWAKYANANRNTVMGTNVKLETKRTEDGWKQGGDVFEEDYGIALSGLSRSKRGLRTAKNSGNKELANKFTKQIEAQEVALTGMIKSRVNAGAGAVMMGVRSKIGIRAETHALITAAIETTKRQEYNDAPSYEDKSAIIKSIKDLPEKPLTDDEGNELVYMSPKRKASIIQGLEDQELQERKMYDSDRAREKVQFEIEKKEILDTLNTQMLDDSMDDDTLKGLKRAAELNFITFAEYEQYKERVIGGSLVQKDTMSTYDTIRSGIQNWTTSDIASRTDLTDGTMRTLISQRVKWEEDGVKFYTAPSFKRGDKYIRESYGYPEASIIPEFLKQGDRERYTEMLSMLEQYTSKIGSDFETGNRETGYDVAFEMMTKQKENLASTLIGSYKDKNAIKSKAIEDKMTQEKASFDAILSKQLENYPQTHYDGDMVSGHEAPPQGKEDYKDELTRKKRNKDNQSKGKPNG